MLKNKKDGSADRLVPIHEVALRFGVSADTVRRWSGVGRLHEVRLVPGGRRYFRESEVVSIMRGPAVRKGAAHE